MKKLYKKEKYKTRVEWLNNRGAFGGSSASAILGANPYLSKLDVYCAAVNPNINEKEDDKQTVSQKYGSDAESIIRELVKLNFASKFRVQSPNGFTQYRRIDKPYMTGTLDGILTDLTSGEKWVLEIKTHIVQGRADYEEWQNHIPQNYFIQGLHYLAVLNDYKGCMYACKLLWLNYETGLPEKEEIKYYELKREDFANDIEILENAETKFYENHIKKNIPPDIEIEL